MTIFSQRTDLCDGTPQAKVRYGPLCSNPLEFFRMRKLIIATAAVALLSSGAFAQSTDKAGAAGTSATSGDTMSKGDGMKSTKTKKSKKSKASSGDEAK
jgi:hypothetical protein